MIIGFQIITSLGGVVVTSVKECTHLITRKVRNFPHLLYTMSVPFFLAKSFARVLNKSAKKIDVDAPRERLTPRVPVAHRR